MPENIDVVARIAPFLIPEDLVQLQAPLDKIALDYNKGLITPDTAGRRAYELLLQHPASRLALDWFAIALAEDAESVGIKIGEAVS